MKKIIISNGKKNATIVYKRVDNKYLCNLTKGGRVTVPSFLSLVSASVFWSYILNFDF